MKKTRKKIGVAICLVALLISTVIVAAIPKNRCQINQSSTELITTKKQNPLSSNIMIFKNCIDYFSNLSKIITQ